MPASSFIIPAKAGIHCGRYLGPPTATDLPGYLQDAAISRISARDPPNEWPLPLAEREQHLDPTTRIPASPVPPQGLDKPERRVELHLRRFGRRARQRLAEYRRRDPALERFAVRTQDDCALLLPIEALRHRGDGLSRRRLVRPHFRVRALGRRADPASFWLRGLQRDGLGERYADSLPRGRTHAFLHRRDAFPGRRSQGQHHRSAGRRPQSRSDHPTGQAVLEREVRGYLLHQDDRDLADGLARACEPPPHRDPPNDSGRGLRQRRVGGLSQRHRTGYEPPRDGGTRRDRKSTRLNSSHTVISYAVFCLKKKKK